MRQVLSCIRIWSYDQEEVALKRKRLKERGQYPAIREQTRLTTNDSLYAQKDYIFLRDQRDQSKHRIHFHLSTKLDSNKRLDY